MQLSKLSLILVITLAQLESSLTSKSQRCPPSDFYNYNTEECQLCSICPVNRIIKTRCSDYSDVVCGPFYAPTLSPEEREQMSQQSSLEGVLSSSVDFDKSANRQFISNGEEFQATVERDDKDHWKMLAFILIGLLSVLIVLATAVVLLACRKLQKVTMVKQPDEGDIDDTDSGYVVIRAIRNITDHRPGNPDLESHPPLLGLGSRDGVSFDTSQRYTPYPQHGLRKLCFLPRVYKPRRWLLNYDTDEVFESDDSGGSMRKTQDKLKTISEKSEKFDKTAKLTENTKEHVPV